MDQAELNIANRRVFIQKLRVSLYSGIRKEQWIKQLIKRRNVSN